MDASLDIVTKLQRGLCRTVNAGWELKLNLQTEHWTMERLSRMTQR